MSQKLDSLSMLRLNNWINDYDHHGRFLYAKNHHGQLAGFMLLRDYVDHHLLPLSITKSSNSSKDNKMKKEEGVDGGNHDLDDSVYMVDLMYSLPDYRHAGLAHHLLHTATHLLHSHHFITYHRDVDHHKDGLLKQLGGSSHDDDAIARLSTTKAMNLPKGITLIDIGN